MNRRRPFALAFLAAATVVAAVQPLAAQTGVSGVSLPGALAGAMADTMTAAPVLLAGPDVLSNSQVEVASEVVRLGDLLSGLPAAQAGIVVAHAPVPGGTLSFAQSDIIAMAARHGVAWQPLHGAPTVVTVTRAAEMISTDVITRAVARALHAQGLPFDSDIELTSAVRGVPVAFGTPDPVGVTDVTLDQRSGRFTATLELPAGDPRATRVRVSGVAHSMIEIPVITRPINRDAVISDADIDWLRVRSDRLAQGIVTDLSDVVGMAARRALRAGEPLRARDLGRPVVVARNDLVTMIVRTNFMTLTSRGRVLDDAGLGDVVRIRNDRSNAIVLGRVIDNRTVVIEQDQNAAVVQ